MSNSKVIVRIGRPSENNKVANIGKKFYTFNGTIVHVSNDLNVDRVGEVPASNIVNKRGTVCVADFDTAGDILEYIEETFQEDKTLSVVYMIIEVDESIDVLYSDPSNPNTWTEGFNFHNVESVIVEDEMPEEVKNSHPLLRRRNSSTTNRNDVQPSRNLVREIRKRRLAQMESALHSVQRVAKRSVENVVEKSTTPTTPANVVSSKHTLHPKDRLAIMRAGYSAKDIEELSVDEIQEVLELVNRDADLVTV